VICDVEHSVLNGTLNRGDMLAVRKVDVCNGTAFSQSDDADLRPHIDSKAVYSVFHSGDEFWLVNC